MSDNQYALSMQCKKNEANIYENMWKCFFYNFVLIKTN